MVTNASNVFKIDKFLFLCRNVENATCPCPKATSRCLPIARALTWASFCPRRSLQVKGSLWNFQACWHPQCFVCTECDELLADLIYFYRNDQIYCGRHFSNLLFPRCAGCDEVLFDRFPRRMVLHVNVCVADLRQGVHGGREPALAPGALLLLHVRRAPGRPALHGQERPALLPGLLREVLCAGRPGRLCLPSERWLGSSRQTCESCRQKILNDQHRISHAKLHWHAREECFSCACCSTSLLKQRYVLKNGKLFCSVECKNRG